MVFFNYNGRHKKAQSLDCSKPWAVVLVPVMG